MKILTTRSWRLATACLDSSALAQFVARRKHESKLFWAQLEFRIHPISHNSKPMERAQLGHPTWPSWGQQAYCESSPPGTMFILASR